MIALKNEQRTSEAAAAPIVVLRPRAKKKVIPLRATKLDSNEDAEVEAQFAGTTPLGREIMRKKLFELSLQLKAEQEFQQQLKALDGMLPDNPGKGDGGEDRLPTFATAATRTEYLRLARELLNTFDRLSKVQQHRWSERVAVHRTLVSELHHSQRQKSLEGAAAQVTSPMPQPNVASAEPTRSSIAHASPSPLPHTPVPPPAQVDADALRQEPWPHPFRGFSIAEARRLGFIK